MSQVSSSQREPVRVNETEIQRRLALELAPEPLDDFNESDYMEYVPGVPSFKLEEEPADENERHRRRQELLAEVEQKQRDIEELKHQIWLSKAEERSIRLWKRLFSPDVVATDEQRRAITDRIDRLFEASHEMALATLRNGGYFNQENKY